MGTRIVQHSGKDDGWTDWINPLPGYRMFCCDCGLAHDFELKIASDGTPVFRMRRNHRSTGQARRHRSQPHPITPKDTET